MTSSILHIVYNLIRGGTEGQCARVAMGLRKRGGQHRVAVFEKRGFFLSQVEQTCGPVYELPVRRVASWRTWTQVVRFARWLKNEQVVLVHAWDADAAMFGSLAARLAGIPYLTSRRDLGEIYPRWKLRWMTAADRHANAVVVNAGIIEKKLLARGYPPDRIVRIPNLFDVKEFDEMASRPFSQAARLPKGRLLVMVARLDPEKDTVTLIRAFSRLVETFADVWLVIAGDGPERPRCEAVVRELKLVGKVLFLGEVEDVPAFLRHACVGLLVPSRNEGQSNSLLEYFAARLPVVATDCGGNRELVEGAGAGYIVPVGSEVEVARRCAELLMNSERAQELGAAGRRWVEAVHSPEKVLGRFQFLYEQYGAR